MEWLEIARALGFPLWAAAVIAGMFLAYRAFIQLQDRDQDFRAIMDKRLALLEKSNVDLDDEVKMLRDRVHKLAGVLTRLEGFLDRKERE